MALKRLENGEYVVKTKDEAIRAIKAAKELGQAIEEIRKENGIPEMEMDAAEMMKAATRYMDSKDMKQLDLGDGRHATLIKAEYDKQWLLTKDDLVLAGQPRDAKPLRSILKKLFPDKGEFTEIWNRVTKRVADPEGINECVEEGLLSEDEIAPALVAKTKKPFVRVFGDEDE